jgi:hypothetical protein
LGVEEPRLVEEELLWGHCPDPLDVEGVAVM